MNVRGTKQVAMAAGGVLAVFFLAAGVAQVASIPMLRDRRPADARTARPLPLLSSPAGAPEPRTGDLVCRHNVFDSTRRPCVEPVPPPQPGDPDDPMLCPTDVTLVGTMASVSGAFGLALVRVAGRTTVVGQGEPVAGLGTTVRVGWRSVLFESDAGVRCLLDLYERGPSAEVGENTVTRDGGGRNRSLLDDLNAGIEVVSATERRVRRAMIEEVIRGSGPNPSLGRARPYFEGDAMRGFRLYAIAPESPLHRLGLRSGDVITAVDDLEMTSLDRPIEAYTTFRRADRVTISYTRRGQSGTLSIDLI